MPRTAAPPAGVEMGTARPGWVSLRFFAWMGRRPDVQLWGHEQVPSMMKANIARHGWYPPFHPALSPPSPHSQARTARAALRTVRVTWTLMSRSAAAHSSAARTSGASPAATRASARVPAQAPTFTKRLSSRGGHSRAWRALRPSMLFTTAATVGSRPPCLSISPHHGARGRYPGGSVVHHGAQLPPSTHLACLQPAAVWVVVQATT